MNVKNYYMSDGKIAVFKYDDLGVGKITLECMDRIMEMLSNQWIPCSERLPAENGDYLVTVIWEGKLEVFMDYFQFGCMWYDCGDNVIAWMPLPEPYKEEDTK